jgi:hypothetical protein
MRFLLLRKWYASSRMTCEFVPVQRVSRLINIHFQKRKECRVRASLSASSALFLLRHGIFSIRKRRTTKSKGIDRGSAKTGTWPGCGLAWKLLLSARSNSGWTEQPTFKRRKSASIFGFRFLKSAIGGIIPFSRTMTVLINPAIPAAPSR